jgi:hypothetical protein
LPYKLRRNFFALEAATFNAVAIQLSAWCRRNHWSCPMMTYWLLSVPTTFTVAAILVSGPALAQNIQFQPRPQFQNQPTTPCSQEPIRQGEWTPLGSALAQGGNLVDVYVNDTMIQAMSYFTRAANRPILYLKVDVQLRDASGSPRRERIMLDGRGRFVPISGGNGFVSEGELRQNIDNFLEPIPPRSAYALVEQHLRERRCF